MKEQAPVGYMENVSMSKHFSLTDLLWAKPRMCQKPRNASGALSHLPKETFAIFWLLYFRPTTVSVDSTCSQ